MMRPSRRRSTRSSSASHGPTHLSARKRTHSPRNMKRVRKDRSERASPSSTISPNDVKDPRIAAGRAALLDFILNPETAGADYRRKLQRLSKADLDELFNNIDAYPRSASLADKLDAIVEQAVEAARDWQTHAVANHRPIYTGTSGHMLASFSTTSIRRAAPMPTIPRSSSFASPCSLL